MDLNPHWEVSISSASPEIKSVLQNQGIRYCLHNSPLFVLILSQINPFQGVIFYFWKVGLNIILPSMPSSSNFFSFFQVYLQNRCYQFSPPYVPNAPSISSSFFWSHNLWQGDKNHKDLHYINFPDSYYFLLGLNIFLRTLFQNHFSVCSWRNVTTTFHTRIPALLSLISPTTM